MAYDLTDFEPEQASPVAVKSPISKSRQDLSDFEPVETPAEPTAAEPAEQAAQATVPPVQPAITNDPFAAFNAKLENSPVARMPEVNLPAQSAVPDVTRPIQPVPQVTPEDTLPVAKDVPSRGVFVNETPTLISNIREGKFEDAAALAKENAMGSKPMRFLFGPTEAQRIAEAVPVTKEDGITSYEYKPASTDAVEKLGAVGAARRSIASLERGIPVTELDQKVESEMMKDDPSDSTLKSIGKGLYNAVLRTTVSLSDPTMALIPESKLVSGAFTLDMANSAKEQIQKGLEADNPREAVEGLLGGVITLGMAGVSGSHTLKPTKADIIEHMDKVPDELLHEANKELKSSDPDVASAAGAELMKRAADFGQELDATLKRLPGDVQEKVNGILQKQLRGEELTNNERATLLQVRSYASRLQQDKTNDEFTSGTPARTAPTQQVAPAEPVGTGGQSVSPRNEPAPVVDASQQGGSVAASAKAKAEAATQPLREVAAAVQETLPLAAQAAKEQADLLAKRAQEQAAAAESTSPPPAVEPPASGQQEPPLSGEERPPAATVAPVMEGAAAKPVTQGTKIVGPVLQVDGKTYAEGKIGQHHKDIVAEAIDNYFKANPDAEEVPRFDHRFKDDQGNIHDRESGWELAKSANQIPPETANAVEALASSSGDRPQLHADHLVEGESSLTETANNGEAAGMTKKPFEVDESLVMNSPHTGDDTIVNFRGVQGDNAVVWTGRSQMMVPLEWLRREGEPLQKKETPSSQAQLPADAPHPSTSEGKTEVAEKDFPKTKADIIEELLGPEPSYFEGQMKQKESAKQYAKFSKQELAERLQNKRDFEKKSKELSQRMMSVAPEVSARLDAAGGKWRAEANQIAEEHGFGERWRGMTDNSRGEEAARLSSFLADYGFDKLKKEPPDEPVSSKEPITVERPVVAPNEPVERPPAADAAATEASVAKGSLLDKLESLLTEEEPPAAAKEAPQSPAQKRVADIQRDIENNAGAEPAWLRRRKKDLKEAQKALSEEKTAAPVTDETTPESASVDPEKREIWQKTRAEVEKEGGSKARHRLEVREAVKRGEDVPLETLEDYSGSNWADKMRREKYGEKVSDTLFERILESLKDESGNLHFDPLFIKSVGKPALRGAVKIIREGVEAGKLAKDLMEDVVAYIKKNSPDADEAKAREFFQPVIDEVLGEKPAPTEEAAPAAESPTPPAEPPTQTEPRMVDEGGRRLTSTKNEIVDQERQRRGEPPILSEAKKSLGNTWDEAMDEFAKNPDAGTSLVDDLNKNPRAITAKEEAILLREKVDVMNDLTKATEMALNASADPADRVEARVRSAVLMDQLNSIDEATRKAGTEWGRTGRFRQMLAAEDYSLSRMLQKSELAKQRPLTPEEQAQVQKMSERIASLEKQLADYEANHAQEIEHIRNEEADKAIQRMVSKPETPADAYTRGVLEKIQVGLKSQADKARARIRARLGKASAGVDPTVIYDVAVIGAEKLFSTGLDFARWGSEMLSDLGESMKEYLTEDTFKKSQEINDKAIAKGAPKSVREKIKPKAPKTPKTDEEQRQNTVNRIAEKRKNGAREAIGGSIQQLAESFVRSGIHEREPLIDVVHAAVKEALPEASRKDIRDAISGYGDYKELSKDEAKVILRDLKGQMQQVSKLEDMLKTGKLPARTGIERRTQSAEERQLLKEVNKVKKELGLESTDPTQLKGALDAAKTRTRNRIEDLQRAIEKKEKIPKAESALKEDAELRDLKARKDAVQKEYDAMFGKAKPTAEEIAADKAQQAVDRAAAALDRQQRINSGELKPEANERAQPLSALEKELRDRTEELRAAKRKADAYKSPESLAAEKAQKGVDAAAAAVDRWDQILKGELERTPGAPKEPLSNLEEELRAQADAMRKAADELRRQPKSEDAKRTAAEDAQIKALEKSVAEYERRIKEMDFSFKGANQGRPEVERVAKVRAARDAAKKAYEDLKKAQTPQKTPEEIALAAYKARTKSRIDELNDRTKRGDFSKKVRKPVELDAEGVKLRAEAARAKLEFDRAVYKDKQKNMPTSERILDYIPKIARANLLSNPVTLAKLTAAAMWRLGASPFEEAIGGALGKLPYVSEIAARAPREGGFNTKAEAKALTDAWMKGMKDAKDKLLKGETDLDVTGEKRSVIPHHWLDVFGNMHGALKAPVVRAEFARSFEKRTAHAAANGVDITDPAVQVRIGLEAYRDSQRAIFQNDNRVVQIWNTAMRGLEQPSKTTGRVSLGNKALQAVAKTIFPIVKIPTNIVAEAFQYSLGSLSSLGRLGEIAWRGMKENERQTGAKQLGKAFAEGIKTLKPEEADLIMREMKKGAFGFAVMLLGFLASQSVGGFYQPGQRRKEDDVKPGTVRIGNIDIPSYLLHNPMVDQLQVGATIGRVANSRLRKKDRETQGYPAGAVAAALGLIEEVPFATGAEQLHKVFTPNERAEYFGELARSRVEPQFIQWMAQQGDRASYLPPSEIRQRKPESLKEEMEMGIPGLRQNVPLKRKRSWR